MKISVIFGTRPEAIKLAPIILELKQHPGLFDCRICVTAQHREMLDQILEVFDIIPDVDLDLMQKDQTLADFTSRAIKAIDKYLKYEHPDLVMLQGDTTTAFCSALTAFYNKITIGHVEAGLRTWNMHAPWPEELNRVLTSRLATIHFAPTNYARDNLLKDGIPSNTVHVTGNTVIDALFHSLEIIKRNPVDVTGISSNLLKSFRNNTMVLITGHRRENFGEGFKNICAAISNLANTFQHVHFVYPVHMNPSVLEPVMRLLGNTPNQNIHIIKPLSYLQFVQLMKLSYLILTDSGGIQEEAPSLGKPVLVMREVTERPEAVEAGCVRLVGTNKETIVSGVTDLLTNKQHYLSMIKSENPYGDGKASIRIVEVLSRF